MIGAHVTKTPIAELFRRIGLANQTGAACTIDTHIKYSGPSDHIERLDPSRPSKLP